MDWRQRAADVAGSGGEIRKPLRGKWQNHGASSAWQQTRSPQKAGHPEVRGSRKERQGALSVSTKSCLSQGCGRLAAPGKGYPRLTSDRTPLASPSLLSSPPSSLAVHGDLLWDRLQCCPTSHTHNFKNHLCGVKNSSPIFQSPKIMGEINFNTDFNPTYQKYYSDMESI